MVRIRLRRIGRKKNPVYRIVVADSRAPRDGKFIEILGQYAPRLGKDSVALRHDRANYWLDNGAQASDTVRSLLRRAGVLKARHEARLGIALTAAAVPLAESAPVVADALPPVEAGGPDLANAVPLAEPSAE
jgi:small subunit ribosomal protein S16